MTLFLSARTAAQTVFNPLRSNPVASMAEYRLTLDDPKQQSRGYRHRLCFPSGLYLLIERYDLNQDLFVETESGEGPLLEFGFAVSGRDEAYEVPEGRNYIEAYLDDYHPPGAGACWSAGQRAIRVEVCFDPRRFFNAYTGQLGVLPRSLQQYLETENIAFLNHFRLGQTRPDMQQILTQILDCPFAGATREIYLEAKCSELVTVRLEPTTSGERELVRSPALKPADIDRIYHARAILRHHFDNPPSLLELARQVGLNDYKLKLGFRQVFDTTVFGYLWAYRMEKARELLYTQQMPVYAVAMQVGYACPSRFTVAFKKRFGKTPSQYLSW